MKVLVTGAAGFIGSHLAERLAERGHQVTGLDNSADYYDPALKAINIQELANRGILVRNIDLAVDDLASAIAGVEVIYHLAAQPGISASTPLASYLRNNITATDRLLQAVESSSTLRLFVNVSTSSVYGARATETEDHVPEPTSYYGVTKLAAEQLVLARWREKHFPCCSLRLFSVYGPRERPEKLYPTLIRSILRDQEFPLYEGSEHHSRSYTFVGDIVDGLVAAMDRMAKVQGQIINLGTDVETTTAQGIAIVERLLGRQAQIQRLPRRPGDQLRTRANIEKARRILEYHPRTSPEVGLASEVEWYRGRFQGGF